MVSTGFLPEPIDELAERIAQGRLTAPSNEILTIYKAAGRDPIEPEILDLLLAYIEFTLSKTMF